MTGLAPGEQAGGRIEVADERGRGGLRQSVDDQDVEPGQQFVGGLARHGQADQRVPEARHLGDRGQAVSGHVADGQHHPAVGQDGGVVPVAAEAARLARRDVTDIDPRIGQVGGVPEVGHDRVPQRPGEVPLLGRLFAHLQKLAPGLGHDPLGAAAAGDVLDHSVHGAVPTGRHEVQGRTQVADLSSAVDAELGLSGRGAVHHGPEQPVQLCPVGRVDMACQVAQVDGALVGIAAEDGIGLVGPGGLSGLEVPLGPAEVAESFGACQSRGEKLSFHGHVLVQLSAQPLHHLCRGQRGGTGHVVVSWVEGGWWPPTTPTM